MRLARRVDNGMTVSPGGVSVLSVLPAASRSSGAIHQPADWAAQVRSDLWSLRREGYIGAPLPEVWPRRQASAVRIAGADEIGPVFLDGRPRAPADVGRPRSEQI